MYKFKELHTQKNEGQALIFSDLSEEDLKDIIVHEGVKIAEIAELFNIDIQLVEKKAQYAVEVDKFLNKQYERFMSNKKFNAFAKKQLFKDQDTNMISKALTHFAFRNGPVEDMHADGEIKKVCSKLPPFAASTSQICVCNSSAGVITPQPITTAGPPYRLHTAADSTLPYLFIHIYSSLFQQSKTALCLYLSRWDNRCGYPPMVNSIVLITPHVALFIYIFFR